ncbi:MAG: PhoX family phosphatase [Alphaproteobacteria bacterium]
MTELKDTAPIALEMDLEDPSLADVDLATRPTAGEPFHKILTRTIARRVFLQGAAASTVGATALATGVAGTPEAKASDSADGLSFGPIDGSTADTFVVPEGYTTDVVIRWGDSLTPNVPSLDTASIANGSLLEPGAGEAAANQFGYNCDACEYFPIIPGSDNSRRGVVCVNHEYTQPEMLFPDYPLFGQQILDPDSNENRPATTAEVRALVQEFRLANPEGTKVELAQHGISVVEVALVRNGWRSRRASFFNRRITAETPIELSGPAAGDPLLQTSADPSGTIVLGTLNNCAGGQTPWGTYLSAEENVDQYFGNFNAYAESADADPAVLDAHARLPLPGSQSNRGWEVNEPRFDVAVEPKECLRFGWVVEVDPYDPFSTPKKRTAIGRFKHECATTILAADNRCVVYSGDDARDEYMYKFVSEKVYDPAAPRAEHLTILDSGTLYAARVNDDGTGEWLPLIWGQGPLTAENGFTSQAEVLIKARKAADLLGATPMDRPEDFEANPVTKKVYCALTNNTRRQIDDPEGTRTAQGREVSSFVTVPNPRDNRFGHILEITEEGDDNAATTFTWEIFMLCGDPGTNLGSYLTSMEDLDDLPLQTNDTYFAGFSNPAEVAPIGSPDNIGFDNKGNLWIVTDGSQPRGTNNGAFAVPTFGPNRGRVQQFGSGPVDCEVCGCEFTPDNRTVFFNIQHPGAIFSQAGLPTLAEPSSYWPDSTIDGGSFAQPRPSLIAVRGDTRGGRVVGE